MHNLCTEFNYDLKQSRKRPISKEEKVSQLGKQMRENFAIQLTENPPSTSSALCEHDYGMYRYFRVVTLV